MGAKTSQLQIRVSPEQKETLKRLAGEAGMSVSAWVLSRALPDDSAELQSAVDGLREADDLFGAVADLTSALHDLSLDDFEDAVARLSVVALPRLLQNVVAGAVEEEAWRRRARVPEWTRSVGALQRPWFMSDLRSLRPHLMRVTPPAYKQRNVFLATAREAPQ